MAKLIIRNLPAQSYTIAGISYTGEARRCENCNRLIHYVAEVWGRTNNTHYHIGMDCAQTLTTASDYKWYQKRFAQVKKIVTALATHVRDMRDPDKLEYFTDHQMVLTVAYDAHWGSVRIRIPRGYWGFEFSASIVPTDWHGIYVPVQEKLTALGLPLPEVPTENPPSKWKVLK